MATPNRGYPNSINLASPNNPPADINALATAIDTDVASIAARILSLETTKIVPVSMVAAWNANPPTLSIKAGVAYLTGRMRLNSGTIPVATTSDRTVQVGTLPAGSRPTEDLFFSIDGLISGTAAEHTPRATLEVDASGALILHKNGSSGMTSVYVSCGWLVAA